MTAPSAAAARESGPSRGTTTWSAHDGSRRCRPRTSSSRLTSDPPISADTLRKAIVTGSPASYREDVVGEAAGRKPRHRARVMGGAQRHAAMAGECDVDVAQSALVQDAAKVDLEQRRAM